MSEEQYKSSSVLFVLPLLICIAGAFIGGFLGYVVAFLYVRIPAIMGAWPLGVGLGGLSGIFSWLGWWAILYRRALRGPDTSIVLRGGLYGIVFLLASPISVFLAFLAIAPRYFGVGDLLHLTVLAILFVVPGGFLLGLLYSSEMKEALHRTQKGGEFHGCCRTE